MIRYHKLKCCYFKLSYIALIIFTNASFSTGADVPIQFSEGQQTSGKISIGPSGSRYGWLGDQISYFLPSNPARWSDTSGTYMEEYSIIQDTPSALWIGYGKFTSDVPKFSGQGPASCLTGEPFAGGDTLEPTYAVPESKKYWLFSSHADTSKRLKFSYKAKNFRYWSTQPFQQAYITIGDYSMKPTGRAIGDNYSLYYPIYTDPFPEVVSWEHSDTIPLSNFGDTGGIYIRYLNVNGGYEFCDQIATFDVSLQIVSKCEIPPLTPMHDPIALAIENGSTQLDWDGISPTLLASYQCLTEKIIQAGGSYSTSSVVRPQDYQTHLWEIYSHSLLLDKLKDTTACVDVIAELRREIKKHGSNYTMPTSHHSRGLAFDMTPSLSSQKIDELSSQCGLRRPLKNNARHPEPWHFEN